MVRVAVRGGVVAVLLLAMAGCGNAGTAGGAAAGSGTGAGTGTGAAAGGTGTNAPAGPAARLPGVVTLVRTGGFVGNQVTVVVQGDGAWTKTVDRGAHASGYLDARQLAELSRLVRDPALAAEARRAPGGSGCADAYENALSVNGVTVRYVDCGDERPPVASEAAELLKKVALAG
jgi:hypothetical protein